MYHPYQKEPVGSNNYCIPTSKVKRRPRPADTSAFSGEIYWILRDLLSDVLFQLSYLLFRFVSLNIFCRDVRTTKSLKIEIFIIPIRKNLLGQKTVLNSPGGIYWILRDFLSNVLFWLSHLLFRFLSLKFFKIFHVRTTNSCKIEICINHIEPYQIF